MDSDHIVCEYGATSLAPLIQVVQKETQARQLNRVSTIGMREQLAMNYRARAISVDKAVGELRGGVIAAVMFSSKSDARDFLSITIPNFAEESFPFWTALSEQANSPPGDEIARLKEDKALKFVVLSQDEPLDLTNMDIVKATNFPWDDWRLIYALVKNDDGSWLERTGAAFDPMKASFV